MKKIKIVLSIFFLTAVMAGWVSLQPVQARLLGENKMSSFFMKTDQVAYESGYVEDSLENIIATIVRIVLSVLGAIFLTLIFWAGNQWMQAAGNEEKIKKSKARIQSALVGLVIVLIAYALSSGFSTILISLIKNRQ